MTRNMKKLRLVHYLTEEICVDALSYYKTESLIGKPQLSLALSKLPYIYIPTDPEYTPQLFSNSPPLILFPVLVGYIHTYIEFWDI